MKKMYALFIVLAASIGSVWAQTTVEVDGVNYNLDLVELTAEVGRNPDASGDITIPTTISYNGNSYDVTTIGWGAFSGCAGLTNINLPNSVTTIGSYAFNGCSLTDVTIPSSVTYLGTLAFGFNLTSIEVEDGNSVYKAIDGVLFSIDGATLYYAIRRSAYTIPANVITIGDHAFGGSDLTSIEIPANVTIIGIGAFAGCTKLNSVIFEKGSRLTTIGMDAFFGTGITKITVPSSVTTIGSGAFAYCTRLETIEIEEGNRSYQFIDGNLLQTVDGTLIAFLKNGVDGSYKILDGVKIIGNSAFYNDQNLIGIEIPASVITIEGLAFAYCQELSSVTFAPGSQLTTIGGNAFFSSGLTEITLQSKVPPTLSGASIFEYAPLATIIVPEGSEEAYKSYVATTDEWGQTNDSWSNYAHLIKSNPTSTERINDIAVIAYPNPTTGIITVTGLTAGEAIKMYSLSGAQVGSYVAPAAEMTIDLSNLSSGMYFVSAGGQMVRIIKK